MKILITGANGFVGARLCEQLISEGHVVKRAVRSADSTLTSEMLYAVGSYDNDTHWGAALKDVEVVVHTAARVHVMDENAKNPLTEFRRVNVDGTLELANQAVEAGVRRFVFISSVKVNGESSLAGHPYTEQDTPSPIDDYGLSKYEAEHGLREIANRTGLEVVIIRPPLIYGSGVKANFANLLHAIQRGVPLPLGAIHNKRSLIGMGNLCNFISLCVISPKASGHVFFISDGKDISTSELVLAMIRVMKLKPRFIPRLVAVPTWLLIQVANSIGKHAAVQRLCGNLQVDISLARNLLEWIPPYTLEEGLQVCVPKKV